MKPNLSTLFTLLFTLVLMSCAPEDNSVPVENVNEFTFNTETYDLVTAIINDNSTATNPSNIGITLTNKSNTESVSNGDIDDFTFVYFDIQAITLQATTYNNIEDYDVSVNGSVVNSVFSPGTVLLSDNDPDADVYAQSGSVIITNFTAFNIDFTFTFTRTDGQVISGRYNGSYLAPNGID